MQKSEMIENYDKILFKSKSILKEFTLCDNCLGRFFIKLTGFSSSRRLGIRIKDSLNFITITKCYICKNLLSPSNIYVKMMQDASTGYEFSSFLVGATLKRSVIERDDKIRSKFRLRGVDGIRTEVTRELGKKFTKKTKASLEHLLPDITFTMNFRTEKCEVKTKPVFLYGRYLKNKRGISQKQESCQDCKGTGCIFCNNHGIVHFDSVEGKISQFLYEKFGSDQVKFTWIGGEDKTSLVKGDGRPFFAKLISPKRQNIQLLKKSVFDEITVNDLRKIDYIPRGSIPFRSKITILVMAKKGISSNKLKKLKHLINIPITLTGTRGKQIKKTIHKLRYRKNSLQSFTIEIDTDGGLPIKRFVEGNNVIPNITKILNIQCFCKKFDINQITLSK
jgi:tRNA pseudouridine synthase 10